MSGSDPSDDAEEPPTLEDLMHGVACMQRNVAGLARVISQLSDQVQEFHHRALRIQDNVVMLVVQQQRQINEQQQQNQDDQQQ